jgi:hypothetical protein
MSRGQKANAVVEKKEELAPSKMNDKRKRIRQAPIPDTPMEAERPESDEQGDGRLHKQPKSAGPSLNKTSTKPKTRVAISKKSSSKTGRQINRTLSNPLDIYILGEKACKELGLSSKIVEGQPLTNIIQPQLNKLLSSDNVGMV